jgi:hypothetical protein
MTLLSPGVEVTIIDESQYIPAATNSVPYVLLATASNKISGAGVGIAAGTLAVNANKTYLITSQRDLSATYGVPFFYKTTAGTPINGYELNEYGLLAAYSALGVSNRCYVQRADIDLAELTATLVRPTGSPANGTYWLDTSTSEWGIFEWNLTTSAFTHQVPLVLTSTTEVESPTTVPLQSIGAIGNYAVVTISLGTNTHNPGYYKRGGPTASQTTATALSDYYNTWVLIGSDEWKTAWPTTAGTSAPSSLTNGLSIVINGVSVSVGDSATANSVTGLASAINTAAIPGVYAAVIGGKLQLYADSQTVNNDSTDVGGAIDIDSASSTVLLSALGLGTGTYFAPTLFSGPSYSAPRWNTSGPTPEPTGSIWFKTNNVNLGASLKMKKYNSTLGVFVQQAVPIYSNGTSATADLDPSGGGANIPAGTTVGVWNPSFTSPETYGVEILERYATGPMICTGTTVPATNAFTIGDTFNISFSIPGQASIGTAFVTATLAGTSASDFCAAISSAVGQTGYSYVTASLNSAGNIVLTHSAGGNIVLLNLTVGRNPLNTAGFIADTTPFVRPTATTSGIPDIVCSYFVAPGTTFDYVASDVAPDQNPADGRLWYYSASTNNADIMIQDDGAWYGYQNVTNDVRGYNLSQTNAAGPLFSATAPTTQNDNSQSPLVFGDLWIDTSDLENYPKLYRWQSVNNQAQWVEIDNTDQDTSNGILFADARWAPNGTTDPISDPIPAISTLLVSNYLDIDAPDPALYPQGTLLFNTRRSGFNVKSFQVDYFNPTSYPDDILPTQTNTWVTAAGNRDNGSPYMGRQSQRALIVAALKSGIDNSTGAREEQREFNLLACPQYPEVVPNLIALNNERNDTAFVVADTPLRLAPTDLEAYAVGDYTEISSVATGNQYVGAFYPSCQTTDLSGSLVVQPPSHMMIRTIIRSDEVAYPWLAPAGTRRGVVDNATQIGYINAQTGEFNSIGVNQALRDVLYENRINPITFVPGVGITNFGNKTTTSIDSALNRINVSRLVAFIRGRLATIAKTFLFEPNDQITRNEITNVITTLMIDLVAKRGIYDYLVVCDLTNNTPARIDRNELYVDIAIEPVKAVEFIYIPVRIKNTGEIASQSV